MARKESQMLYKATSFMIAGKCLKFGNRNGRWFGNKLVMEENGYNWKLVGRYVSMRFKKNLTLNCIIHQSSC